MPWSASSGGEFLRNTNMIMPKSNDSFLRSGEPTNIWMIRAVGVTPANVKDFKWNGERRASLVSLSYSLDSSH